MLKQVALSKFYIAIPSRHDNALHFRTRTIIRCRATRGHFSPQSSSRWARSYEKRLRTPKRQPSMSTLATNSSADHSFMVERTCSHTRQQIHVYWEEGATSSVVATEKPDSWSCNPHRNSGKLQRFQTPRRQDYLLGLGEISVRAAWKTFREDSEADVERVGGSLQHLFTIYWQKLPTCSRAIFPPLWWYNWQLDHDRRLFIRPSSPEVD